MTQNFTPLQAFIKMNYGTFYSIKEIYRTSNDRVFQEVLWGLWWALRVVVMIVLLSISL